MQDGPEEQLLADATAGDREAFSALYASLVPMVERITSRVLRDPHLAEEVAQEVFLAIWTNACSFDPACAPARRWVTMVAHRRAVDRVRAEERQRRRSSADANLNHRAGESRAEADAITLDRIEVASALDDLPAPQRQAIELVYLNGLTHQELADVVGIPLGTAKGRVRAGLDNLRRQYGEHGPYDEPSHPGRTSDAGRGVASTSQDDGRNGSGPAGESAMEETSRFRDRAEGSVTNDFLNDAEGAAATT